jgi:hypothetical protein
MTYEQIPEGKAIAVGDIVMSGIKDHISINMEYISMPIYDELKKYPYSDICISSYGLKKCTRMNDVIRQAGPFMSEYEFRRNHMKYDVQYKLKNYQVVYHIRYSLDGFQKENDVCLDIEEWIQGENDFLVINIEGIN